MIEEHWNKLINSLSKKIDIVGEIDIIEIMSKPFDVFYNLEKYVNFTFKPNQRLIITQIDTLYFIKNTPYSISLYNLFVMISNLGIPTEHCLILTNQNIKNEVAELSQIFDLTPMKVFISYYNTIQTTPKENVDEIDVATQSIKYSYCCLNGLKRSSRLILLCDLDNRSLIDKGIVTWNFSKPNIFSKTDINEPRSDLHLSLLLSGSGSIVNDAIFLNSEYRKLFTKFSNKFSSTSQIHPLVNEFEKLNSTKMFQPKFLQYALIYLVTETIADYPYPYLSEKTFKGFLIKRPMIIWGAPHSIKRVRELGFKTWDSYWDESYDSISSISDRCKAICNIIEDVSKLNVNQLQDICINMKDVLEYNYHWYVNEFADKQLEKLVQNSDV